MTRPDTNTGYRKFLCELGFHKMPKWSDPILGTKASDMKPEPRPAMIQHRSCTICNARKLRLAR